MITSQDIRGKTFEKAVFGGYDMATVDGFLDEVANDLALLQRENATLKAKMKVLVDKVEEYRSSEDTLRKAVLSAQKLGVMIEQEAREQAASTIADAKAEAARILSEAHSSEETERARLSEAKAASASFIENMDMLCRRQMEFLNKLGETDFVRQLQQEYPGQSAPAAPAAAAAPVAPQADPAEIRETVKSIEETIAKVMDEPVVHVQPDIQAAVADDERPTRTFNILSDAEDATTRFSPDAARKA
ncbi:MAG: DivIVA domain-containing protein [Oscillospiraceae bacterium]|nr:DivIVA domain-containing protein [Oscillospiraceae bacterium]